MVDVRSCGVGLGFGVSFVTLKFVVTSVLPLLASTKVSFTVVILAVATLLLPGLFRLTGRLIGIPWAWIVGLPFGNEGGPALIVGVDWTENPQVAEVAGEPAVEPLFLSLKATEMLKLWLLPVQEVFPAWMLKLSALVVPPGISTMSPAVVNVVTVA